GQGDRPRRPDRQCDAHLARHRRPAPGSEGPAGSPRRSPQRRARRLRMSAVRPTLEVGYVARAHGIQGEIAVRTFDPQSRVLEEVSRLVLQLRSGEERAASIESARRGPDATLLVLAGVRSRAEADALRGATVRVHRTDLPL